MRPVSLVSLASLCWLSLSGCDSRPLPGASVPGPPGAEGPPGAQGPQGPAGPSGPGGMAARVPAGVWLDGVNSVAYALTDEGLAITSRDTSGYTNVAGGFDDASCQTAGSRSGNKALVGLSRYSGTPLRSIEAISVTARQDRGQPFLYFNLIVDCDGNGAFDASDAIVVADSLTQPALTVGRELTTVTLDPARAQWKSVGGRCGLPSNDGAVGAPLTTLPATAKLLNARPRDCGMPRGTDVGAILLIQGDSLDRQFRHSTVQELAVTIEGKRDRYRFVP